MKIAPDTSLRSPTSNTSTNNSPCPWVTCLLWSWPKAILRTFILQKLTLFLLLIIDVQFLNCFIIGITTNVPEEDVVCNRAKESQGMQNSSRPKKKRKRSMDECISEVTMKLLAMKTREEVSLLWISNNTPNTFTIQIIWVSLFLSSNLYICQHFHRKPRAK